MHDPMIQAFEIKYPWWRHKPWPKKFRYSQDRKFVWNHAMKDFQEGCDAFWDEGYRDTFITIWHVDPEKDGSDDSCGWSYPKLTPKQKQGLRNGAWHEVHHPHFLVFNGKEWEGTHADAVSLYEGMIAYCVRLLRVNYSLEQIKRMAIERIHFPDCCKPTGVFCYQPGYHTNNPKDSERDRQEHFFGILCGIARCILDDLRPWYRHPKWHFWHWKLQCQPLMQIKRILFSRCSKCGGMFKYGESCVSHQWNSPGPRWFRGEPSVMHDRCSGSTVASDAKAQTA